MAAALAVMVAGMSRGKKAYVQYESQLSDAIAKLTALREELKAAITADAESYNNVMRAYKEAKAASAGDAMVDTALKGATTVPLGVVQRTREVLATVEALKPITNRNMASDLTVAAALGRAAVEGALANVEINLQSIKDAAFVADIRRQMEALR
jgi:formiminotetrahydrofolate cyclodeaminase